MPIISELEQSSTHSLCGVCAPAHRSLGLRVKSGPETKVALVQLVEARLLERLGVHDLPQLHRDVRSGAVDPPLRRKSTIVSYMRLTEYYSITQTCTESGSNRSAAFLSGQP